MTKRVISMLLAFCMVCSFLPVVAMAAAVADGDLPAILSVAPSQTNNLPSTIDLCQVTSSTGGWGGGWGGTPSTTSYHLYLPGNVDASKCFFSWDGGLTTTDGTTSYASGSLPVPAPGTTKTYVFTKGTENKKFEVTTYQGSQAVKPIFIEIDESKGTIAAMNGDREHETICTGDIIIDGVRYGLPKIKGRGNATWSQARQKRAYNLTLDQKVNILGIDSKKTKKWSILANIADHTLLRCKVGFDMAHAMDIGQDSASADVWMNGVYQGTYLVTPKTDSFVSDDGYMVENDNYKEKPIAEGGDPSFELEGLKGVTNSWGGVADYEHNRITVKKIGDNLLEGGQETVETLTAASAKIQAYMQEAWDAIRSPDGYNSQGKYYTDYVDLPSWAAMYLMHEYVKSFDVNAGSIMFHRDGTADTDKLIAGPLWDLDNALGRTSNNGLLGSTVDQMGGAGWYIRDIADGKTSIFKTIGQHEDFMEEVTRVYNQYRAVFEGVEANLDALAEEMAASAEMNFKRVTSETYNNANVNRQTVKNAGTEYEQVYKVTNTWSDYVDNLRTYVKTRSLFLANNLTREDLGFTVSFQCGGGSSVTTFDTQDTTGAGNPNATSALARNGETGEVDTTGEGQVNFKVVAQGDYAVTGVTAEPAENYGSLVQLDGGVYRLTNVTGPVTVRVATQEIICEHEFVDGVCTKCGKAAFRVEIACDAHCSVTAFPTQDLTTGGVENATSAYARNSATGEIDISGDGQMNFVVHVDPGYEIDAVTATGSYKNLKDLGDGAYRLTKINGAAAVQVKTKLPGPAIPASIDFTDPASADRFELVNPASTAIRPGQGLYLVSTKDAFEPCNGQLSGTAATTPKDLVKIPVEGDWTATMKFNFNQGGSQGWYEFFGFYVMDDYNNAVGMRGGDGAIQDFLRKNGSLTADTPGVKTNTGLKSANTHWFRIEKSGEDYTCYWSTNGDTFTKVFGYTDTGIHGDYLVIDAYSGMATGYNYLVEYVDFEAPDAPAKPKPRLASVSVNGQALADFDPETFIYNYEVSKDSQEQRVLTAVAAEAGIDVSVEQIPGGKFGTAVITASNGVATATYTFSFNYGPEDDYFADGDMSDNWSILHEVKDPTPQRPWTYYRFEEGVGLVMPTQKGSIYMAKQADPQGPWTNVFLMPAQGDWEIITKSFYPQLPKDIYQQTQVFAWQDEDHYIRINCQYNARQNLRVEPANEVGSSRFDILDVTYATPNPDNTATLYYKVNKTGNKYTVSYSTDCKNWVAGGSVDNLNYIDPKFGLFVTQDDGNDNYIELSFEYVAVTSRNGQVVKTDEQVLVWAAQNAADYMAAGLPETASETLTVKAPHGYTVEFVTSNPDVIAADGTVTPANDDTAVEVAVKVTEGDVTATSKMVVVNVPGTHEIPDELAIVTEPVSFVGKVGEHASFTVEVNRSDVTYQWYFSNNGGKSWGVSTLLGNDTASMVIPMKAFRVGQMYRVVVTDSENHTVESQTVSMTTASKLALVTNPVDSAVALDESATFTVQAEGEGLHYQWMYSNNGGASWCKSTLPGSTTETVTVAMKAFRAGQQYKCVVTDASGNIVESAAAKLIQKESN